MTSEVRPGKTGLHYLPSLPLPRITFFFSSGEPPINHKHPRKKVNLADEETESQRVLGLLLIFLTVGLLVVAVVECLWEARRLSRGDRDGDDDDFHIFRRRRRRDGKGKEGGGNGGGKGGAGAGDAMEDKLRSSGALYAPKLLDVPMNRVRGRAVWRFVWVCGLGGPRPPRRQADTTDAIIRRFSLRGRELAERFES